MTDGTQTFTCEDCGKDWSRPTVRGTRPRRCPPCRAEWARTRDRGEWKHEVREYRCPSCGVVRAQRVDKRRSQDGYCSPACRKGFCVLPKDHPVRVALIEARRVRNPIKEAYRKEDWDGLLDAIYADTTHTASGCWEYHNLDRQGYGTITINKRVFAMHRLARQAEDGGHISSHMPVHHTCANRACCNPAHLQVITQASNIAEMLERRYYTARIAALEEALRVVAPDHSLVVDQPTERSEDVRA